MADFTMYDREREFKWQIECQLTGGTNAYIDAEDIYSGRLTRQISSGEGIEVGSCYVSELDLTIVASALPANVVSVKPFFRLLTSTEIVDDVMRKYYTAYNLGVFKIASTKRKEYGRIDLVCYDKMADLDALITPAAYTELLASDWKPFYLLDWIATKVDVTYTFTQSGIEAMPNGTLYFKLAEETSNIKTYRDLLQYVCMLIGAYGIFDEDGHLNIKTFADTTSYSLPASFRFSESFGDAPITYSGVELTAKNTTTMFGNANNTVVTLSDNPFLYTLSTLNQTTDYATFIMQFLRNIYIEFQGLSYYAGEFEIPPDASLNVGRLLAVSGGGASDTINCFLQKIDVNFDGRMSLSCGNPNTYVTRTRNRTTSSITNLTNRIETLESAQGDGVNKVYISELAPTVADNAIGNEGDLWYKVKRKGHFEGAVLKCIRAGKMTEPNMEFTVGQYVRVNYGNYYNNNSPCIKHADESWAGYHGLEYISLSASGIINANTAGKTAGFWGHMIGGIAESEALGGFQTLRLWTCNYDEERMITSNEVARGGFGRTGVGYNITYQGKNYYLTRILSIGGVLTSVYYDAESSDEHMVNPAAVQAEFDSLALFEIVDWGEGTSFNYDGTIIERMTLERYVKYDGVWVTADYKAGKGIIIENGSISVNTSTSVDIVQNVTSGTQLATINDKPIYAPTVNAVQTLTSGTEIATINVGDTSTPIYAPTTTVTQTLTEGTEIGEVNGTKLYAPSGGGSNVTVTPITTTGTNIANIAVNGTTYSLFAPTSGGGSHNYSTNEQVVGTWIDGSTLYEKTIEITVNAYYQTSSGAYFYRHNIENIKNCVACDVKCNGLHFVNGSFYNLYNLYTFQLNSFRPNNEISFVMSSGTYSELSDTVMYVTLQYTKTS